MSSPIPWKVFHGHLVAKAKNNVHEIESARGDRIIRWGGFDGTDVSHETDFYNADFIVLAVNNHARLVAALEGLANCPVVSGMAARIRDDARHENRADELAEARSVLAEVKGSNR